MSSEETPQTKTTVCPFGSSDPSHRPVRQKDLEALSQVLVDHVKPLTEAVHYLRGAADSFNTLSEQLKKQDNVMLRLRNWLFALTIIASVGVVIQLLAVWILTISLQRMYLATMQLETLEWRVRAADTNAQRAAVAAEETQKDARALAMATSSAAPSESSALVPQLPAKGNKLKAEPPRAAAAQPATMTP